MSSRRNQEEVEALLKEQERNVRRLQRQLKQAPGDADLVAALEEARRLRTKVKNHQQMAFPGTFISEAPDEEISRRTATFHHRLVPPLALSIRNTAHFEVGDEGCTVTLSILGALRVVAGPLPGILDVTEMRYTPYQAIATAESPSEALALAEEDLRRQLRAASRGPDRR